MRDRPTRLASVLAAAACLAACAGRQAVDLDSHFDPAAPLLITHDEAKTTWHGGEARQERMVIVTRRTVLAPGRLGSDAVRWRDRIVRVAVDEEGPLGIRFDSARPGADDTEAGVFAALVGMELTVDVAPDGTVRVSDVVRPFATVDEGEDAWVGQLMRSLTSDALLEAQTRSALDLLPSGMRRVGDTWIAPVPYAWPGMAKGFVVTWTLERVQDSAAHLRFVAEVDVRGMPFQPRSMDVAGELTWDLRARHPRRLVQRLALELAEVRAEVVRTVTFEPAP